MSAVVARNVSGAKPIGWAALASELQPIELALAFGSLGNALAMAEASTAHRAAAIPRSRSLSPSARLAVALQVLDEAAQQHGRDPGGSREGSRVLERAHRRATWPTR